MTDKLLRGGVGSLAVKGAYVAIQLATSVFLARALGPGGYGQYALVIAVVALTVIPGQFGIPHLLVRMVAIYSARGENALLNGLLWRSAQIVAVLSTILAVTGALLFAAGFLSSTSMPVQLLGLGLVLVPLLALLATSGGAVRGMGHVVVGQVPDHLIRPLVLLAGLVALGVVGPTLTPRTAVLANIAATAVAVLCGWLALLWLRPRRLWSVRAEYETREWVVAAFPFLMLAGTQVINHQTDILMLGLLTAPSDVGLYRVGVQVADGMGMALMALSATINPYIARLHSDGDWPALQQILVKAHRTGVALLLPLALVFLVFATPLLRMIFGEAYVPAATALVILAFGKVGYASIAFCGGALGMFGLAKIAAFATGAAALLNVVLNLVLIPLMGIEGAAVATASSAFGVNVVIAVWIYRTNGVNVTAVARLP